MADKLVKKNTRKDKKQLINNLANRAEEAAAQHNMKELYNITRRLAGKRKIPDRPTRLDREGNTLTTQEDQLKRWTEHFRELLNRARPTEQTSQHPSICLGQYQHAQ